MEQAANNSSIFVFTKKIKATKNERFDKNSILGIKVAGKTSKLDAIYITLIGFKQENILLILI